MNSEYHMRFEDNQKVKDYLGDFSSLKENPQADCCLEWFDDTGGDYLAVGYTPGPVGNTLGRLLTRELSRRFPLTGWGHSTSGWIKDVDTEDWDPKRYTPEDCLGLMYFQEGTWESLESLAVNTFRRLDNQHRTSFRILFVDDDPLRQEWFKKFISEQGVIYELTQRWHVDQVTQQDLKANDLVCLDHDMCQAPIGSNCPIGRKDFGGHTMCLCKDGTHLVKTIIDPEGERHIDPSRGPRFIIHSANGVGGRRMVGDLERYGYEAHRADFTAWKNWTPSVLWRFLSGQLTNT